VFNTVNESNENNNANRGDGLDRETVWGEKHLPAPLDGASVQAETLYTTFNGEIGGTSEWIGGYDIDVMQTTLYAGETTAWDVDAASTLDSALRVYNSSWQLVAQNDNGAGAGEAVGKDPFIQYTATATGTYYLVMSAAVNKACNPLTMTGRTTGAMAQGSYTIQTSRIYSAPTTPDLLDGSDTGVSQTDNITRDNTATYSFFGVPNMKPQLIVNGSVYGLYVTVNPSSYYEVTCPELPDGEWDIAARFVDPSTGYASLTSDPVHITIDTVSPQIGAAVQFDYSTTPHAVTATFLDDVGGSLGPGDVSIVDLATQVAVGVTYAYDPPTHKATFRVASHSGVLPMGNDRATLNSAGITDTAGNPLVGASPLDFFFVPADANHDRYVNGLDFAALAANFNKTTGVSFATGDFNYDGRVNALDFSALATNFGTYLAPPSAAAPPSPATDSATNVLATVAETSTGLFSTTEVTEHLADGILPSEI